MTRGFDPGPRRAGFLHLMDHAPGSDAYPYPDFRTEWGPVFYRGRLDGSARILVIGQDPGQHECVARRAMVGEAGRRVQGFLAKLGITRSYVILNAFLYCVASQQGADTHRDGPAIRDDRDAWLTTVFATGLPDAVVAFGRAAEGMYRGWEARHGAGGVPFEEVPHPTSPRPAPGVSMAEATRRMLVAWNAALGRIFPALTARDVPTPALLPYGVDLGPDDLRNVPAFDFPPGSPAWMWGPDPWADRGDPTTEAPHRARIVVTVPAAGRGWL